MHATFNASSTQLIHEKDHHGLSEQQSKENIRPGLLGFLEVCLGSFPQLW